MTHVRLRAFLSSIALHNTNLLVLSLRYYNALVNSVFLDVGSKDLLPKHVGIVVNLLLCPFDQPWLLKSVNKYAKITHDSLREVASFSLKLARYQSTVCLIPVNTTIASSEIYFCICPSKRIVRIRLRVRVVRH